MLTLITGNAGKAAEFERLLGRRVKHVKLDLPEIQETDVRKVSAEKAKRAYKELGSPVFVDDTGLVIRVWNELPGALIKHFLDNVGNDGILAMLGERVDRSAYVITSLGYCDENGVKVCTGVVNGLIASEQRGENGFGYDPIFVPEGYDKTFAEMTGEEKDAISMRAIAAQGLKDFLNR